jgi:hypothetical protein
VRRVCAAAHAHADHAGFAGVLSFTERGLLFATLDADDVRICTSHIDVIEHVAPTVAFVHCPSARHVIVIVCGDANVGTARCDKATSNGRTDGTKHP